MSLGKVTLLHGVYQTEVMYVLIDFLQAIKHRVGHDIQPSWLITDDAEQFYTAWTAVFGTKPHKLLCMRHVDRAWRKAIDKITDKEIGALTYYNLRVLMEETDKSKFEELFRKTIEQLKSSNTTQDFFAYFMKYYVDRKQQWAACYRIKSGINTIMYVESFHRVLKYIYLKGRSNKRVDRLLHVLMKLARDKGFKRLCKLEKGKITGRLARIRQRNF